jgi:hypothetical protein
MTSGFTALAFSFCAAIVQDGGADNVALGYVSNDKCEVMMIVGDSHGDTATINGHDIGVELLLDGAVVHIDDLQFVIQKTEGV